MIVNKSSHQLRMTRRIFITFLIIFIGFAGSCQKSQSFRFVFMTDIHVQPEGNAEAGFQAAIEWVNALKPDFVITGGDLIYDALGQSYERSTELYDIYLQWCEGFVMPVYQGMGNHDVFGLYTESGIEPGHPEYGKTMYLNRMGLDKAYYSFDHKGWHFIILDPIGFTPQRTYVGRVDSVQLAWLEEDLSHVDPTTPIVVSLHIPLASIFSQMMNGATAPLNSGSAVINSKAVLDRFANHNLKLVLQGHLHIVEQLVYKDVHFITGGAVSGEWWRGTRMGFEEGFVVVAIEGDDFDWSYEDYGWEVESKEQ